MINTQGVSSCYLATCPVTGIDAIKYFVLVIDATAPSTSNISLKVEFVNLGSLPVALFTIELQLYIICSNLDTLVKLHN
jgi:hypothetical protein